MDYNLVKKLKENGFPQEGLGMRWNGSVWTTQDIEGLYQPTLEELIEFCGDKFEGLIKDGGVIYKPGFFAIGLDTFGLKFLTEHYSTPSIAVAELWLAINKK